jgi:hypothetical protein
MSRRSSYNSKGLEAEEESNPTYAPPEYSSQSRGSTHLLPDWALSGPNTTTSFPLSAPPQWEASEGESHIARLYPFGIYHDAGINNFDRGVRFCEMHPIVNQAQYITYEQLDSIRTHASGAWTMNPPSQFDGKINRLKDSETEVKTNYNASIDKTLVSSLPVLWGRHDPKVGAKGIYFEVKIEKLAKDAVVAVGFGCLPYPTDFRLPGWHRHSAAVHSDDGFKFFENSMGGIPFTHPVKKGGFHALDCKTKERYSRCRDLL